MIAKILASNIVARRKSLHMTQAELAECIGLSTTSVQKIERCEAWVGTATVAALAKGLKCTEIDLFQAPPGAEADKEPGNAELLAALAKLQAKIDELQSRLAIYEKPRTDEAMEAEADALLGSERKPKAR